MGTLGAFSGTQTELSSFCFVRWSALPGIFPSVASCFRGLTTFLYQTERKAGGPSYQSLELGERGRQPWSGSYGLVSGQEDEATGEAARKAAMAPSCPQAPCIPRCLVLREG